MFAIITIPYDRTAKSFDDEVLNRFFVNKQVKSHRAEFFMDNGNPCWTVFVEYENILEKEPSSPPPQPLNREQQALFDRLKVWRKARADKDGVPVFVVATNKELYALVTTAPKSYEALKTIHGFGQGKISKYGQDIIGLVTAFYKDKP
jgi:superfamily II DNA helicase RecQ